MASISSRSMARSISVTSSVRPCSDFLQRFGDLWSAIRARQRSRSGRSHSRPALVVIPDKLRGLKPLGELADRRMPLPPHETEVHAAHAVDALAMRDLGGEHQGVLGACTGFVDLAA